MDERVLLLLSILKISTGGPKAHEVDIDKIYCVPFQPSGLGTAK